MPTVEFPGQNYTGSFDPSAYGNISVPSSLQALLSSPAPAVQPPTINNPEAIAGIMNSWMSQGADFSGMGSQPLSLRPPSQFAGLGQWGAGPGRYANALAGWNSVQGTQGFGGAGEALLERQTRAGPVPFGPSAATFGARNRLMMPRVT
jgi:hypothetical protein